MTGISVMKGAAPAAVDAGSALTSTRREPDGLTGIKPRRPGALDRIVQQEPRRVASEAFDLSPVSTPTPAAYSSLPSSPRRRQGSSSDESPSPEGEEKEEQDIVGLGIGEADLERPPHIRITRSTSDDVATPPTTRERDDGVEGYLSEPETEDWWPARSRRNTLDSIVHPFNARSPRSVDDIAVFQTPDGDRRRRTTSVDSVNEAEAGVLESEEDKPALAQEVPIDGASLWALLKDDQGAEGWEDWLVEGKWERIQNFLAVPLAVERVSLPRRSSS